MSIKNIAIIVLVVIVGLLACGCEIEIEDSFFGSSGYGYNGYRHPAQLVPVAVDPCYYGCGSYWW